MDFHLWMISNERGISELCRVQSLYVLELWTALSLEGEISVLQINSRLPLLLSGVVALLVVGLPVNAQMILTADAITAGFGLTTFTSGFSTIANIGPLGITFDGNRVIVSDYPGNVRVFPTDVDGQLASSVAVAQNYGVGNAVGLAQVGANYYMTQQGVGSVVQINPNGSFKQAIITGLGGATGIAANPLNGHLFVSATGRLVDIDPVAQTFSLFKSVSADGVTTDGLTLYASVNNHIIGYRISDGAQVFDTGFISGGSDGTALGTGSLAGNIFVNTNDGHLLEYNLFGLPVQTIIGQGGSRGDFVTVDPNGTLLLTQSDRILRLIAPQGGGFGSVPEPGSLGLFGGFALSGAFLLRRRRK